MEKHKPYGLYEAVFKRIFDIICSLLFIIIFSWLYIIIAVLVRIKLGGPVIFKQKRPGKNGKIFDMYKFRSMTNETDKDGNLLPDAQRMTKFGHALRKTSLDELPEIFCILFGTMSIVGPRPLLIKYLPYYTEKEAHRHDVRPGLTGWAQIHGRNSIATWEQRFEYDIEYVNNITFLGDVKILFLTIANVLKSEGVVDPGFRDDFDVYRMKMGMKPHER